MALFANKGKELPVLEIVGNAGGGQHLLAPEFAAPESANLRLVVVTELERLPRLVEHLIAHERIDKATRDEAIHLRAEPTLKTHVLKRGTAHRVRHGNGRASIHASRTCEYCREKRTSKLMGAFHGAHYSITRQSIQENLGYNIAILLVLFRQAYLCYTLRP